MPSKRRSVLVQSSVEACTPPGETSLSQPRAESHGSLCVPTVRVTCAVTLTIQCPGIEHDVDKYFPLELNVQFAEYVHSL